MIKKFPDFMELEDTSQGSKIECHSEPVKWFMPFIYTFSYNTLMNGIAQSV
jgi:hypothetical protein